MKFIGKPILFVVFFIAGTVALGPLQAQMLEPSPATSASNPFANPTMTSGKQLLFDLEAKFAKDVAEKGGAGFADGTEECLAGDCVG